MLRIVGAREASLAGRRFAADWRRAGPAGFVVVSGLARGIDAAAHEAALGTGTVRRAGRRHRPDLSAAERRLQAPIAARGLLLAEAPIGHAADRPRLPAPQPHRQRPVARVVVVEAAATSGS
jgi:DNA processing protein